MWGSNRIAPLALAGVMFAAGLAQGESAESRANGAGRPRSDEPGQDGARCSACHDLAPERSHPIGIPAVAASGLQPDLPLDAGGRMDCLTCHLEPQGGPQGPHAEGVEALLRRPAGELCASCHVAGAETSQALRHGLFLGRAHLAGGDRPGSGRPGLDELSRSCLACHDGSAAPSAGVKERAWGGSLGRGTLDVFGEHPVGVEYDPFPPGGRPAGLRHEASLPSAVRLSDGKVGCGSCHSLYSALPALMAMDNRRGALCLSCHIK